MLSGTYLLKHPIIFFARVKLDISYSKKKHKMKACLRLFHKRVHLTCQKRSEGIYYFAFSIDIVQMLLIVKSIDHFYIDGFFDTPIGHVRFVGKKVG